MKKQALVSFINVPPVAGRITYTDKDGFILLPGLLEGLSPPGVPVHGVVGMLQEIGALLLY